MMMDSSDTDRCQVPFTFLVPFLLIAFGHAWGIFALFIFLADQMTDLFGKLTGEHPLFFLAVYAPAIAAFSIIVDSGGTRDCAAIFPGCCSGAARRPGMPF